MARFMNGRKPLFLFADNMTAPFGTEGHLFTGFFKFRHSDNLFIRTSRQQGRFIQKIAQVGTGKPRSFLGNGLQIHILAQGLTLGMNIQYSHAPAQIRTIHRNLTVKTAGTKQSRIENIRSVCCRNRNNAFISPEAVHFNQ